MGKLKELIEWECEKCSRVADDFLKVGLEGEAYEDLCDYVKKNAKPVYAEYCYIGDIDKDEWKDEYLIIFTNGAFCGYGFAIRIHKDGRVEYILEDSSEYEVINVSTKKEFLNKLNKLSEKELIDFYFADCKEGIEKLYSSLYIPFTRDEE